MRNLTTLLFCVISMSALAQETKLTTPAETKEHFTCQHAIVSTDGNTMTLVENVKITSDRLYLEADSVVFDQKNKTFVAFGYKKVEFNGELVLAERPKNIIRYTLKDEKLFIE